MSNIKNLRSEEAIKKLHELVLDIKTCFFGTHLADDDGASYRPMATQDVDDQGNIWFMSDKHSLKNNEIKSDSKVQLFYSDPAKASFVVVTGRAEELFDRNKTEELWTPFAKTWFREGKDDSNISLIRVRPETAYYWDVKGNRMVNFFKYIAGAATGKPLVEEVEGSLNVK